jgi:serralysin
MSRLDPLDAAALEFTLEEEAIPETDDAVADEAASDTTASATTDPAQGEPAPGHWSSALCGCAGCGSAFRAELIVSAREGMAAVTPEFIYNTSIGAANAVMEQDTSLQWNAGALGIATHLTYAFANAPPPELSGELGPYTMFSALQQAASRQVLQLFAEVANVTFEEIAFSEETLPDILFGGNLDLSAFGFAAVTLPYTDGTRLTAADIFFDHAYTNPVAGNFDYLSLIHEVGHALGLKHFGDYGDGTLGPFANAYGLSENRQYSVMSYNEHPNFIEGSLEPVTPQLLDIAALQALYGANISTRAGNDVYSFTNQTVIKTIWDGGGIDTIDASGLTTPLNISLGAGPLFSIGGSYNVTIAYGVQIENVTGGSASDLSP